MPEDTFRIVIASAVILASLAFLVQAGMVIGLYRATRRIKEKVAPLAERGAALVGKIAPVIDKTEPLVEKLGPLIAKARTDIDRAAASLNTLEKIVKDVRPRLVEIYNRAVEISNEVTALVKFGGRQVARVSAEVGDVSEWARHRLEQIDYSVTQVEHASETMKRAMLRPVREVNGLAAGVSAAASTLAHGTRSPSVNLSTQDERIV